MRKISFTNNNHIDLELEEGTALSSSLTTKNSPILFGCRTGLCGTCLIEVVDGGESLHPMTEDEKEYLQEMHPEEKNYRLACQISLNADIKVKSKKEIEKS